MVLAQAQWPGPEGTRRMIVAFEENCIAEAPWDKPVFDVGTVSAVWVLVPIANTCSPELDIEIAWVNPSEEQIPLVETFGEDEEPYFRDWRQTHLVGKMVHH